MKSILKAGIDKLPKTFNVKPEGIPNALKKMGVKDEEIEFSMIDYAKEGKVSKADLQASEAARRDQFGVEQGGGSYNWVSLKEGQQNPTYKENVYTFKNPEAPQQ